MSLNNHTLGCGSCSTKRSRTQSSEMWGGRDPRLPSSGPLLFLLWTASWYSGPPPPSATLYGLHQWCGSTHGNLWAVLLINVSANYPCKFRYNLTEIIKFAGLTPGLSASKLIITILWDICADHSGRAVCGMNCLRSLKRCDRGLVTHSRHSCLYCVHLFYLCPSVCR
jgi:hypothetical protein